MIIITTICDACLLLIHVPLSNQPSSIRHLGTRTRTGYLVYFHRLTVTITISMAAVNTSCIIRYCSCSHIALTARAIMNHLVCVHIAIDAKVVAADLACISTTLADVFGQPRRRRCCRGLTASNTGGSRDDLLCRTTPSSFPFILGYRRKRCHARVTRHGPCRRGLGPGDLYPIFQRENMMI